MNEFTKSLAVGITPYEADAIEDLQSKSCIKFDEGLPAFEAARDFVLLTNEQIHPFLYLNCLDEEDLGFVCISPFAICKDYNLSLTQSDLSKLDVKESKDVLVLCLVTIRSEPTENTANLLAPIVINLKTGKAGQIINENNPVKYKIWDGIHLEEGE